MSLIDNIKVMFTGMKTQYKILLITALAIVVTIPAISAASQKSIDTMRCMESTPYPTIEEASEALQSIMDEHGGATFVSGAVNFPAGAHSQQQDLPTTITLCIREASTFEP